MEHGPEEQPTEDELGELAKALFKLPPDAVDTSDLEEGGREANTG